MWTNTFFLQQKQPLTKNISSANLKKNPQKGEGGAFFWILTWSWAEKRRAQSVPKETGTDTSALVGCSIGQVLDNHIRDFHSLPAGVPHFHKRHWLRKKVPHRERHLSWSYKNSPFSSLTKFSNEVSVQSSQTRIIDWDCLNYRAPGGKVSNNTYSWSSSSPCQIISIIRDKENWYSAAFW